MRRLLVSLIAAAAALPFLASCSATVAPDGGYGYYDNTPTYYAPSYYYGNPYPRYHEYHTYYHPYYHHDDDHRHVVVEHHHEEPGIHGQITVER